MNSRASPQNPVMGLGLLSRTRAGPRGPQWSVSRAQTAELRKSRRLRPSDSPFPPSFRLNMIQPWNFQHPSCPFGNSRSSTHLPSLRRSTGSPNYDPGRSLLPPQSESEGSFPPFPEGTPPRPHYSGGSFRCSARNQVPAIIPESSGMWPSDSRGTCFPCTPDALPDHSPRVVVGAASRGKSSGKFWKRH